MAPMRPCATSSARRLNPLRHSALAPLCPRSSSITSIRSTGHPKSIARWRSAY
jgi:hypothetical protein